MKNKEITLEEQTIITGADNSELKNMGTIKLKIKIQGIEITAYVITHLTCEILLGNNVCLKYDLVIDFGGKKIKFKTGESIEMDKIWVEYNGTLEGTRKTEIETKIAREYILDKIIATEDTIIAPKTIADINFKTNTEIINEKLSDPVDRLNQKLFLKLEKNVLEENDKQIQVYNFSNLYINIYEGTVMGTIE